MLSGLAELEPQRRAGVLSRAALALDSDGINPASNPIFPEEIEIRKSILKSIYDQVKITDPNISEQAIKELVIIKLDEETSELSEPVDINAALDRLSKSAALSSDVYNIEFSAKLIQFFSELPSAMDDRSLVIDVVKSPDVEQNYGRQASPVEIWTEISILGKWFNFGRPKDRFLLLVTGRRSFTTLTIYHAWRVYPSDVNIRSSKSLHEVLARFANMYGRQIKLGDWKGKFLFTRMFRFSLDEFFKQIDTWLQKDEFATCMHIVNNDLINVAFALKIYLPNYVRSVNKHLRHQARISNRNDIAGPYNL